MNLLSRNRAGYFLLRAFHGICSRVAPYEAPALHIEAERLCAYVPAEVRASGIPGAGQGLFLTKSLESGALIGEYCGDMVSSVWRVFRLADHSYLADTGEAGIFVDARRPVDAMMRYVNHHFDRSKLNCTMDRRGRQVFIVATRSIAADEELFLSYGERYWQLHPERKTRVLARRLSREYRQSAA